jgi:NAD(P)-dependent dehydrogenase (short-subunit alcohol dehydrogenase family)
MAPLAGVTGGARGIGAAYVSALLTRGFTVAIFDVDGAVEAAAALGGGSSSVSGWPCDVADALSFRAAFDKALGWSGQDHFRVFVCNAGVLGADGAAGGPLCGSLRPSRCRRYHVLAG